MNSHQYSLKYSLFFVMYQALQNWLLNADHYYWCSKHNNFLSADVKEKIYVSNYSYPLHFKYRYYYANEQRNWMKRITWWECIKYLSITTRIFYKSKSRQKILLMYLKFVWREKIYLFNEIVSCYDYINLMLDEETWVRRIGEMILTSEVTWTWCMQVKSCFSIIFLCLCLIK